MAARHVNHGFTLIEMVLTMVVSSILILGIAGFIELGATGYVDSIDRQRLQTQARFMLEKMSREIRHSIPNLVSTELSGDAQTCLNFYPIDYSGFYTVSGADLLFVIGDDTGDAQVIDAGRSLIINPTRMADADNAVLLTSANTSVSGAVFTLAEGAALLSSDSVAKRVYLYQQAVAYCVEPAPKYGRLYRTSAEQSLPLSDDVVASAEFRYDQTDLRRGGIVHLDLNLMQNGESSHYQQDVQVLNVP